MTTPAPATAEDLVRLAASIDDHPTLEQVDALLDILREQSRNDARSSIVDGLLEMRSLLAAAA